MTQKSLLGLSILFHATLGLFVARIEMKKARAATAIEMSETKKREVAKKIEENRPPPDPPKKAVKRAAAVEKTAEAPPPEAAPLEALPDFGLELSGGVGGVPVAPVGAGVGVNAGPAQPRAAAPIAKRAAPVRAAAAVDDGCDEPAVKPKPRNVPQPAYTDRARAASIEGKVRVELTVDETGRVVSVRVLQGLGYGLDEAAVAAAERASFEPALRCGKPARATFTISMRFSAL